MKKLASNIDFIKDDSVQIITIDGVRVAPKKDGNRY
jgi:hypothetical protein